MRCFSSQAVIRVLADFPEIKLVLKSRWRFALLIITDWGVVLSDCFVRVVSFQCPATTFLPFRALNYVIPFVTGNLGAALRYRDCIKSIQDCVVCVTGHHRTLYREYYTVCYFAYE